MFSITAENAAAALEIRVENLLRRTAVGPVKLGMLAPGQFRQLDKQEVRALRTMAQKGKATAQIEKNTRRRAAGTARGPRAPKGAEKRGNRP